MSIGNMYPFRDSLNGDKTINFDIPVRQLQITNTSPTSILKWKFKESQNYSELEPTEIIIMEDITTYTLLLSAINGSYRVLGQG